MRTAVKAFGFFAAVALMLMPTLIMTGCESGGDRVDRHGERTQTKAESRMDDKVDEATDSALDRIFDQ